jgi:hypothetical protein
VGDLEAGRRVPRHDLEDLGEQRDPEQPGANRDARPDPLAPIPEDAHGGGVEHPFGLVLPVDERPPGAIPAGRQPAGDGELHPVVD